MASRRVGSLVCSPDTSVSLRPLLKFSSRSSSLFHSVRCRETRYSSAITSSSLTRSGPRCERLLQLRMEMLGPQKNSWSTSISIIARSKRPMKKWPISMTASPLRLYQAHKSSGILRGIGMGSSPPVSESSRVLRTSSPLADHKMP